ncbi:MAG: chorismate synthase [Candidatus Gracilibacteria bacterium]|jgi:chorismate synthase
MGQNSFGNIFKITTWGESHGEALGVVIDGCPPLLELTEKDIQKEVDARKPVNPLISTSRTEEDQIKILSGVFEGKTTGTPISMIVENQNKKSEDYENIKNTYRPGHADLTYDLKYKIRDYRGGGRSSGRETICRVMAGAIAKKYMKEKEKTVFFGHTIQIGNIKIKKFDESFIDKNPLKCGDRKSYKKMMELIEKVKKEGNSIGAIIEIIIKNVPTSLGDPIFRKLDAELAKAMMSIGAIKGVEIGSGFSSAEKKGSENNDQIISKNGKIQFLSNNNGGILGGISTGQDIVIRLAIKPVSSISIEQKTIDKNLKNSSIKTIGRHDVCLAPRIIPVATSMAAIVLMDAYLQNKCL